MNFFRKKSNEQDNLKFIITFDEFTRLYHLNNRLRTLIDCGGYLYVDEVICLNSKKFVLKDKSELYHLTKRAKRNLSKCCLSISEIEVGVFDKGGKVNRDVEEIIFNHEIFNEITNIPYDTKDDVYVKNRIEYTLKYGKGGKVEEEVISKYVYEVTQMMVNFPNSFGDALKYVMKWSHITNEKLAENTMISTETISRMRSKKNYEPKLKTVIAICIALRLPPLISFKLIELAGYQLRETSEEHIFYSTLLSGSASFTVEQCNELLNAKGYSSLV